MPPQGHQQKDKQCFCKATLQSDHLQSKTWKVRWLWTFASTRKMKSERARLSQLCQGEAGGASPPPRARFFALTADCASLSRSSSFSLIQRSRAISIATFRVVFACSPDISTVSDLLEFQISRLFCFRLFSHSFACSPDISTGW